MTSTILMVAVIIALWLVLIQGWWEDWADEKCRKESVTINNKTLMSLEQYEKCIDDNPTNVISFFEKMNR